MNNDLISREALKEAMRKAKRGHYAAFSDVTLQGIYRVIDNAPTIECERNIMTEEAYLRLQASKERPQGKWITRHKQNSFGQDTVCFECDKCHKYTLPLINTMITEPLLVCPNCGVDMRKGGAE